MDWNDPWAEPDHDDNDIKTTHTRGDDDNELHAKNVGLKQYGDDSGGDAGLTTKAAETHLSTGAFALGTFGGSGVWDEPWARDEDVVSGLGDGVWGAEVGNAPVHVPTPALKREEENGGWGDEIGHVPIPAPAHAAEKAEEDGGWGDVDFSTRKEEDTIPTRQAKEDVLFASSAWDAITPDTEEHKESEASDSATTIQADDDAHTASMVESTDSLQRDDDVSTRPSTTSSEVSRVDGGSESPRTSFEEVETEKAEKEDGVVEVEKDVEEVKKDMKEANKDGDEIEKDVEELKKDGEVKKDVEEEKKEDVETVRQESVENKTDDVDDFGDFEKDAVEGSASSPSAPLTIGSHTFDSDLLAQLFPPSSAKESQNLAQVSDEALEDPIYLSSGTRKAWYRVTRKQTLREYDSGDDYDHYIRITWKTSTIRNEVNKVVSRWATEDRMAGRGPGARASFYWDTTAPKEETKKTRAFHGRQSSNASVSSTQRQSTVLPIQTDVPTAAFGWSTSPVANPWTAGDKGTNSILPSTTVPKHSAIAKLQRQEGRGVSVDLTTRPRDPVSHKRNATSGDLVKEFSTPVIAPILPPPKPSTSQDTNPWAGLDAFDTDKPSEQPPPLTTTTTTAAVDEDDDDWGEMVESPAISTMQTPFSDFSIPPPKPSAPPRDISPSPPSTRSSTPKKSATPSPLHVPHAVPTGSKNARPIVRLKGTVSPTSTIFKANALIPTSVEQGPIGPSILRPRGASRGTTVALDKERIKTPPRAVAQIDKVMNEKTSTEVHRVDDGFSAFEASLPEPEPEPAPQQSASEPSPLPEPVNNPASWADSADFSIFESSVPAAAPVSAAPPPSTDPTHDPWSIFDSPTAEFFTRSRPDSVTPSSKLSLTGTTHSARTRKLEENEIIREIVEGLPSLGYMLKQ